MLESLRYRIGHYQLKNEFAKANVSPKYQSFKQIKSIFILFVADSDAKIKTIENWLLQLIQEGKSARALGYIPNNEKLLPISEVKSLKFYNNLAINRFFVARSLEIDQSISTTADLLIDLNFKQEKTLSLVKKRAPKLFTVSNFRQEKKHQSDWMLDLGENPSFEKFIENFNRYFKSFNIQNV
jgi:hypothetical protein